MFRTRRWFSRKRSAPVTVRNKATPAPRLLVPAPGRGTIIRRSATLVAGHQLRDRLWRFCAPGLDRQDRPFPLAGRGWARSRKALGQGRRHCHTPPHPISLPCRSPQSSGLTLILTCQPPRTDHPLSGPAFRVLRRHGIPFALPRPQGRRCPRIPARGGGRGRIEGPWRCCSCRRRRNQGAIWGSSGGWLPDLGGGWPGRRFHPSRWTALNHEAGSRAPRTGRQQGRGQAYD